MQFLSHVLHNNGQSTAFVGLTDQATIATDCNISNNFKVTLAGNRTLGNPTNAKDGQVITWLLKQDSTGTRGIALGNKFRSSTTIVLSTDGQSVDCLQVIYNAGEDKFEVINFIKAVSLSLYDTPSWYNVKNSPYNAAGDATTSTGSISSASNSLTISPSTGWKIGMGIVVAGAGTSGTDLVTTVTGINGGVFVLQHAASTTVSSVTIKHTDSAAINAAIAAASSAGGGVVYLPRGTYNITSTVALGANNITLLGDGDSATVLQALVSSIPTIEITGYSASNLKIENLQVKGTGPFSGVSGHGIYVHDNTFDTYRFWLDNVRVIDCGGHGIYVTGHFNNEFSRVLVSNCGQNAFDLDGGNTITLRSCYVDDLANNKVGYRVHSGQLTMINCNGLDSLGSVSDWAVFGDYTGDGDSSNRYVDAILTGCNVEAFKRYGVYYKVGSSVSFQNCFFTTSTSGSTHVAIKSASTGNYAGIVDGLCRFNTAGTGTWANSYPVHGTDSPVVGIGSRDFSAPSGYTKYWNTNASSASRLPSYSAEWMLSQPLNVKSDYGCLGNDTDETAKIQQAINDCSAAGGGIVYFPKGTYRVTGLTVQGSVILIGESHTTSIIKSVSNAVIIDCSSTGSSWMPNVRSLKVLGSVTAGSNQIGIKLDDSVYGLQALVADVRIEDCGSHGLYVGKVFSSHIDNVYSSNNAGCNYFINAPNMPAVRLSHCDSGVVRDSYRTGYHVAAGHITFNTCNGIYGGNNPEWCYTIGRKIGFYGETSNMTTASASFEHCNFESNTKGGIQLLFNSRASFKECTWVGAAVGDGIGGANNYKAILYDVCQVNPIETTGSITTGTNQLVVASLTTWTAGQGIQVTGAGAGGSVLTTTVSSVDTPNSKLVLATNAGTTVSGALVVHTDEIFYPTIHGMNGTIDSDSSFSQGGEGYYANNEPVHMTAYPATGAYAATHPPLEISGRGPKISASKFVTKFYNDTTSAAWMLPRADGFFPIQVITGSTTIPGPGTRFIECNHTAPITLQLPWPGVMNQTSAEMLVIKDISTPGAATNPITLASVSGGTVNGSTYVISHNKGSVILIPHNDTDWRVVGIYTDGLTLNDGSLGALTIQRYGDTDTGAYTTANGWFFAKDGAEYARLSSNDNRLKGTLEITTAGAGLVYTKFPNEPWYMQFNGTNRWIMQPTGALYPAQQDSISIGTAGGGELASVFAGTSLVVGVAGTKTGELVLKSAANSNTLTLKSGTLASSLAFTLPTSYGTSGQYLKTLGNGTVSWDNVLATPGGSSGDLQYNNAGALAGTVGVIYGTNPRLKINSANDTSVALIVNGLTGTHSVDIQQWSVNDVIRGAINQFGDICAGGPFETNVTSSGYFKTPSKFNVSNSAGSDLIMSPGVGTGTALGGSFIVETAPAGTAGTSQNGAVQRLLIDAKGNHFIGTAVLATNATDGFFNVPQMNGAPSGAPTTQTGSRPIVLDATNKKLLAYIGSTWRDVAFGTLSWTVETSTGHGLSESRGVVTNNASRVTVNLPSSSEVGAYVRIVGKGAGGWRLAQAASQQIIFGNLSTTSGVSGYIESNHSKDCVELVCTLANLEWTVISSVGNITVV